MKVLQDRKITTIVIEKDDEVIITTDNKRTGCVSIHNDGEIMTIEDISKRESEVPYKERQSIAYQKAQIRKEKQHHAYLERKANKK